MTIDDITKAIGNNDPIEWLAENHDKIFYVNNKVKELDPITYGVVKGIADIACNVDYFPNYMQEYFDISLEKMELAVSDSVIDWAKSFANIIDGMYNANESLVYGARDMLFNFQAGSLTDREARLLKSIKQHFFFIEFNTDGKLMIFLG